MDVDLFLDPLADPEPIEDYLPLGQNAQLDKHRLALRALEIQREQRELLDNLYDVLAEEPPSRPLANPAHVGRALAPRNRSRRVQ